MQKTATVGFPGQIDSEGFLKQIAQVYLEVIAGMRRPEQLARWLSDAAYYDLCTRARRNLRGRQVVGGSHRPIIASRQCRISDSAIGVIEAVVTVNFGGLVRAVSIRAEPIYDRMRITEVVLVGFSGQEQMVRPALRR